MSDGVTLSPKHGLNASLLLCPCCGKDTGLALLGRLKDDAEAPRRLIDRSPCDKCRAEFDEMRMRGMLLLIVRDEAKDCGDDFWPFYVGAAVINPKAIDDDDIRQRGTALISESEARRLGILNALEGSKEHGDTPEKQN